LAKKKQIKIVRGIDSNYTFLDTMSDTSKESNDINANAIKDSSNVDKNILKTRSIDSKKRKVRHKNRIMGGLIQQSHSSVYE
jgi:hypothetical protein